MSRRYIAHRVARAALLLALVAQPVCAVDAQSIRVVLVGDSTMATQTGYGDALCGRFQPAVFCLNMAKGGRSSASYRAEGSWDHVMKTLSDHGQCRATYVLIQFGHNDQPGKPGRSTDLKTEFPANMARYVQEVKSSGAIPVVVTPLVRRNFQGTELQNDLHPWAEATRQMAATEHVPLLDLNADSFAAVQEMGSTEADSLAMAPLGQEQKEGDANAAQKTHGNGYRGFDRTHLGAKGAAFFSLLVEKELSAALPSIVSAFKKED